jgi:hypothetical protein
VSRIQEHIAAGDVYQLVLASRFSGRHELDPFKAYRALRLINPSPYMYYCALGDVTVVGSSPEALVKLSARHAQLRPIAGTRPRSTDSAGDAAEVSFETLVQDALTAAEEGRRLSGARRVIWLGVRFGALIAAEALRRQPGNAAALSLWEPLFSGADYFRQLARGILFAAVARGEKPNKTANDLLDEVDREGKVQTYGSYLYRTFYDTGRRAELAKSLADWCGPTQLAQIQPRLTLSAANTNLVAKLEGRGAPVCVTRVSSEPGWQISGLPWVSDPLLNETGDWLNALA